MFENANLNANFYLNSVLFVVALIQFGRRIGSAIVRLINSDCQASLTASLSRMNKPCECSQANTLHMHWVVPRCVDNGT